MIKQITQYEAAKALVDAAVYTAAGLGFEVKCNFVNTVPLPDNVNTVKEGIKDVCKGMSVIMAGCSINPRDLQAAPPPKPSIILPGE